MFIVVVIEKLFCHVKRLFHGDECRCLPAFSQPFSRGLYQSVAPSRYIICGQGYLDIGGHAILNAAFVLVVEDRPRNALSIHWATRSKMASRRLRRSCRPPP